ncbi:MAG: CopD family protein [Acidimicrobiia bacterium]|nr:CopD family protein [Acidimicrobiia bacterium]
MSETSLALWVHLIFVSIWVGGQVVVAFLVPTIRRSDPDPAGARRVLTAVTRRFQAVAWSALVGALFSGIWLILLQPTQTGTWARILFEKLTVIVLAALAVAAHAYWIGPQLRQEPAVTQAETPPHVRRLRTLSGISAAAGLLLSLLAMWLGIRLFLAT